MCGRELAIAEAHRQWKRGDSLLPQLLGTMDRHLMTAQLAWNDMLRIADD